MSQKCQEETWTGGYALPTADVAYFRLRPQRACGADPAPQAWIVTKKINGFGLSFDAL